MAAVQTNHKESQQQLKTILADYGLFLVVFIDK
jgi:hypothetical protein